MAARKTADKQVEFEGAMARLEQIVTQLERGEAPLKEAMGLFEEGTSLIKTCSGMLDRAEQQVSRLLSGPDGEIEEIPFEVEE